MPGEYTMRKNAKKKNKKKKKKKKKKEFDVSTNVKAPAGGQKETSHSRGEQEI